MRMTDQKEDGKNAQTPPLLRLGVMDGVAGAIAGFTTEFIFYGMDSYKIMRQSSPNQKVNFKMIFKGILPIVSLGAIPCYGVFFGCYRPLKKVTDDYFGEQSKYSIFISSTLASIPSALLYVPADTIKKRMHLASTAGEAITVRQSCRTIYQQLGYSGFFLGWQANLARDVPFSAIKMCLFEAVGLVYAHFSRGSKEDKKITDFSRLETAFVGFVSGAITAVITNPLDCVNTRIKSGELEKYSIVQAHMEIIRKDGVRALYRGVVPRSLMVGVGASVFWYMYANAKALPIY